MYSTDYFGQRHWETDTQAETQGDRYIGRDRQAGSLTDTQGDIHIGRDRQADSLTDIEAETQEERVETQEERQSDTQAEIDRETV